MPWRRVADRLRPTLPRLADLTDQAEPDVLAYMSFRSQGAVQRARYITLESIAPTSDDPLVG